MYTAQEQEVLLKLGHIYDHDGRLTRGCAEFTCSLEGEEALDTFHALEASGDIVFQSDGRLYHLPGDGQITGE